VHSRILTSLLSTFQTKQGLGFGIRPLDGLNPIDKQCELLLLLLLPSSIIPTVGTAPYTA
jgi:hypothetical protein